MSGNGERPTSGEGVKIYHRAPTKEYTDGWEAIWGKRADVCETCGEPAASARIQNGERRWCSFECELAARGRIGGLP